MIELFALLFCAVMMAAGPEAVAPSPLIAFTRTGGLAGFNDSVEILPSGKTSIKTRQGNRASRLSTSALSQLTRRLRSSRLFYQDRSYTTSEGADHMTYTLRYQKATVTMHDDKVPAPLKPAVDQLLRLIQP